MREIERAVSETRPPRRSRLDELLVERGLAPTRARARALIMAGKVLVDGQPGRKAGELCATASVIALREPDHPYVSRGGVKLAGALDVFAISPNGLICADIGSSTGGFVDCLLQRGAARVWAVDTGDVLDDRLRPDPRIRYLPDTNARYLTPATIPEPVDLITMDLSFISITKVIPAVAPLLATGGRILGLIKPQFEAGRGRVGKGGIVRDTATIRDVLGAVITFARNAALDVVGLVESQIRGAEGNREFFVLLRRSVEGAFSGVTTEALVERALAGGSRSTSESDIEGSME